MRRTLYDRLIDRHRVCALAGMVFAAGDIHATPHGAFGSVGFGIGPSDIEHLLAAQLLPDNRRKTMRVSMVTLTDQP